jgi:hypothetical protein
MVVEAVLVLRRLVLVVLAAAVYILVFKLAERLLKLVPVAQQVTEMQAVTALCNLERMPPVAVAALAQLEQMEQQLAL